MKFRVGDKVKVIKEGTHCQKKGDIVEILRIEDKSYYWECPYNGRWYLKEDEVSYFKLTKEELIKMSVGTVITTNAEDEEYQKWIKIDNGYFVNIDDSDYYLDTYDINEDLTIDSDDDYGTRITKIEEPEYTTTYDYSKEIKEMTVAEIEKELGHAVKIIKEEN